jgi:hypothetical protein
MTCMYPPPHHGSMAAWQRQMNEQTDYIYSIIEEMISK